MSRILVNCARHGHGSRLMYTTWFHLLGSSVHHESELMLLGAGAREECLGASEGPRPDSEQPYQAVQGQP